MRAPNFHQQRNTVTLATAPTKRRRHSQPAKKKNRATVRPRKAAPRSRIVVTERDRAAGRWFARLVALEHRLCGPGGCPWDREQTHASLRKYLIEETYEVLDAMESGDTAEFASELGDLLLQIVFHSVLAETAGTFTISNVIEEIYTKMVRRHPHVFGDVQADTPTEVLKNWEQIKAQERKGKAASSPTAPTTQVPESILAGVSRSFPAVLEAYQLTRRASRIGFDWPNLQGVFEKLDEEKRELAALIPELKAEPRAETNTGSKKSDGEMMRKEEEAGDLLFAAINVCRFIGVDPEIALKKANHKFRKRFQWMETAAAQNGGALASVPREHMEELWDSAKQAVRP